MYENNRITKDIEYKMLFIYHTYQKKQKEYCKQTSHKKVYNAKNIQEEGFQAFCTFLYGHAHPDFKNYTRQQLGEIYFDRKYTIFTPEYNPQDGLDYQCLMYSL